MNATISAGDACQYLRCAFPSLFFSALSLAFLLLAPLLVSGLAGLAGGAAAGAAAGAAGAAAGAAGAAAAAAADERVPRVPP